MAGEGLPFQAATRVLGVSESGFFAGEAQLAVLLGWYVATTDHRDDRAVP